MNKTIFLTFILIYSYQSSFSQSIDDAFRLNSFFHNGSARFNSMGGAFGALGGDISAISINPSGSSVFLNSEIGFNIDFQIHCLQTILIIVYQNLSLTSFLLIILEQFLFTVIKNLKYL